MLVLTRRTGESVEVGPDVRVTIVKVWSGKVQIGFEAPRDVEILRSELERDDDEEKAA